MKKYFLAVTTILLTSLNLAGSAEAACKFTFRVELMKLETVDVGDTSNSMGDMTIMDADLYYKNKPVGTAVFNTYLNRMADPNAVVERRRLEQRLGIAQYRGRRRSGRCRLMFATLGQAQSGTSISS